MNKSERTSRRKSGSHVLFDFLIKWDTGLRRYVRGGQYSLLFLIVLLLTPPAYADIPLALVAPFTGSNAVFGDQLRHGAEQAVKDINAAGGVLGQKLVMKNYDDACDPKEAVNAANKVAGDGTHLAIAHFCSGAGLAAMPIYMDEKIFTITPGVGHPKFTEEADTFTARIAFRHDIQGEYIASYIAKHHKGKNVVILNDKSAFGVYLASAVQSSLRKHGMKEVLFDSYSAGEKDYTALAARMKDLKADIIAIGGYHAEAALIAKQLRAQGSTAQLIGGTAFITSELWSIAGKNAEGVMGVFGPDQRKEKRAAAAIASIKKGGFDPEGFTLYAYAAVQTMAQAIKNAASTDAKTVVLALRKGTYSTVVGDLTFDAKGDVRRPHMVMYRLYDGEYEEIEE